MIFRCEGDLIANCFVDASFNCHPGAKGHTGYVVYTDVVGSAAIVSRSVIQKCVAQSSMEAELVALHEAVIHLLWCANIMEEFGYEQQGIKVFEDNQAAIRMSKERPVNFKGRSKFIDRKYFGVHSYVESGKLELVFVGTDDNVADFLTKALSGGKFKKFRLSIMGDQTE